MKVVAVIPVGPGHERISMHAVRSVHRSWNGRRGPFAELEVVVIDDMRGELGRSAARNRGMAENPADWYFLLDADDQMAPAAFGLIDLSVAATFGAINLSGRGSMNDRHPVTRNDLFRFGAEGTLAMGCFVRGDLGLRFDESMDIGEDFDFYMRLPSFTKRDKPLAIIGYKEPSATGPRANPKANWLQACATVVERYRQAEAHAGT